MARGVERWQNGHTRLIGPIWRRRVLSINQRFQTGGGVLATLTGFGDVRALVIGNYAEMSDDLHQLRERAAWAASEFWERLGSRTRAEAVSYFSSQLRYSWGVAAARAFARHRLRRVIYVGAERLPRAAQLTGQPTGEWAMASRVGDSFSGRHGMGAGSGGWRCPWPYPRVSCLLASRDGSEGYGLG